MRDENVEFRNRIKEYRLEKKLTQSDLAFLTGATRQSIALIEGGKHCPTVPIALKIAHALDAEFIHLFYLDEVK